jgi:hypothetical protein
MTANVFIRKPVPVEAIQFVDWASASDIFDWIPRVFYVPKGADHPLRNKTEYNQGTGEIYGSAAEFLVLKTVKGTVRVNPSSWVVRLPEGKIQVFSQDRFDELFATEPREASSEDQDSNDEGDHADQEAQAGTPPEADEDEHGE